MRVLAVAAGHPSKFNPDWPTLQQQGVRDVDASIWTALFAPKATPEPIIDRLNVEVARVLELANIKARFAALGVETIASSPAQLDARVKRDAVQFARIVQKANIKPD